jgi:Family of unknown function (DUF6064)
MYLLATLWIWNAVAYHALLFTSINPAAWLFAGLFTVEGVLLFWAAARRRIESPVPDWSNLRSRDSTGMLRAGVSVLESWHWIPIPRDPHVRRA